MSAPVPAETTKGERTRERLRRAATRVFAREGYEATRVADIVREAGVTQPTFYLYFASKEAAYEDRVEAFRQRLQQTTLGNLLDPSIPHAEFTDRVALSFRRFLDLMAEDRELTEIGFFQPPGCTITKARLVHWVADNIAREQADRLFRGDLPAELIARLLVGLLEQFGRMEASDDRRRELARACAELFCHGTRPPPG
ncbi:TetR/AcrR family transcriptional regulator [Ancylobacter sonchi]|uniref:TetR/AcrR family transcriptional regulator n=1 Tax=Ancylobacter sonchi TaxID=1937790 RepID=UPI001BD4165A|nr:TetR/AcrR family transcriptional regulator [Ancylobacter sonchi]MBS7533868.1 TetR/AcrR family transcriptional regulator [Ancylobacter sonchi]